MLEINRTSGTAYSQLTFSIQIASTFFAEDVRTWSSLRPAANPWSTSVPQWILYLTIKTVGMDGRLVARSLPNLFCRDPNVQSQKIRPLQCLWHFVMAQDRSHTQGIPIQVTFLQDLIYNFSGCEFPIDAVNLPAQRIPVLWLSDPRVVSLISWPNQTRLEQDVHWCWPMFTDVR